jgi:hypothetical protein
VAPQGATGARGGWVSSSSGLYDCLQTTGTAENCLKPTRRGPPIRSKMDKSGHPVKQQPQPPSLATRIP